MYFAVIDSQEDYKDSLAVPLGGLSEEASPQVKDDMKKSFYEAKAAPEVLDPIYLRSWLLLRKIDDFII
jgi:hypothetical protein